MFFVMKYIFLRQQFLKDLAAFMLNMVFYCLIIHQMGLDMLMHFQCIITFQGFDEM